MGDFENKCLLCGGLVELMSKNFVGYQEDMIFQIYRCNTCQVSFPQPQIDASKLYDVIYKDAQNVPGYGRYWAYFNEIKKKKNPLKYLADSEASYWGVQEALKKLGSKNKQWKILEIGSGLGYLTYALRQAKYDIVGLDISKEAVDRANKHFGDYFVHANLFDYVVQKPKSYDVVILTEVIEHVENPFEFIEAIFKLLKPDGKMVMTTPNKSIAPKDIIWDSEAPPIHHWWFTENSIQLLSQKLGAATTFIDFSRFYIKNPKLYKPDKIRKNQYRSPIIGKDWELIRTSEQKKGYSKTKIVYKKMRSALGFIKYGIFYIVSKIDRRIVFCSKRGTVLCAVLQKK